ncbi:MAG TPA: hypothetical protein VMJ10_13360, partial [Kofleriaceae bacterium]|nr:hypothetical protein [Kofleriaceae bacterium]
MKLLLVFGVVLAGCGKSSSGGDGGSGSACADQAAISHACTCQGATRTSGYCCSDVWQSVACSSSSNGLLNPDVTTTWNPGILVDTPTSQPLGNDGLPVR